MAKLTCTVVLKLEQIESNGSSCDICEDNIYLNQYAYILYMENKCTNKSILNFCQSCANGLDEEQKFPSMGKF